ncbi:MAG: glycosyltransferase [Actinomycetota bacterium]|nr:glycosyltransferase [Actinomycetota bacterium]MDP2287938.1 glycosyltransferase [Actinomycetota bacterium]
MDLHASVGNIDRLHGGLIAGWFGCRLCKPSAPDIEIIWGTQTFSTRQMMTRPDVPTGFGFWFADECWEDVPPHAHATIRCARHPLEFITRTRTEEEVRTHLLVVFTSTLPARFSGQVWRLDQACHASSILLANQAGERLEVPLREANRAQLFDGLRGHASFELNMVDAFGYLVRPGDVLEVIETCSQDLVGAIELTELAAEVAKPFLSLPTQVTPRSGRQIDTVGSLSGAADYRPLNPSDIATLARFYAVAAEAKSDDDAQSTAAGLASLIELGRGVGHRPTFSVDERVHAQVNGRQATSIAGSSLSHLQEEFRRDYWRVSSENSLQVDGRFERDFAEWLSFGGFSRSWAENSAIDAVDKSNQSATTRRIQNLVVAGLVGHKSGLGNNAAASVTIARSLGLHTCTRTIDPHRPQIRDLDTCVVRAEVSAGHDALLHLPLESVPGARLWQSDLWTARRTIGFFMWETSHLPNKLTRIPDLVDEIWTGSTYVADLFANVTNKPVRSVGHLVDVTGAVEVDWTRWGIPQDAFVVLFTMDANSTAARKNPAAAVKAFLLALGHDTSTRLVIHVRNAEQLRSLARAGCAHSRELLELVQGDARMLLLEGELSRSESLGLIASSSCYLSLHRSEGFGYSIAEAMALGTPVIATGYSGNMDYCSSETSLLVDFELVRVNTGEYFYPDRDMWWAEPDIEAAAVHLQTTRDGRGVRARVQAAAALIQNRYSMEAMKVAYASAFALE